MGWKVGNGSSIMLGVDPIAGMNSSFTLSLEFLSYLNDYGIITLNHAHNLREGSYSNSYWLTAEDMELASPWKEAWAHFTSDLSQGGVRITNQKDNLTCMFNKENGQVTEKIAYEFLLFFQIWKN